ncbi:hypothetical protein ACFLYG_00505 [Chloroflexota bacterium]
MSMEEEKAEEKCAKKYQGTDTDEALIASHLRLRRVLGVLGVALPVVLLVWGLALGEGIRDSISAYYSLGTAAGENVGMMRLGPRDAFVGTLLAIAWFLWTYKGPLNRDNCWQSAKWDTF